MPTYKNPLLRLIRRSLLTNHAVHQLPEGESFESSRRKFIRDAAIAGLGLGVGNMSISSCKTSSTGVDTTEVAIIGAGIAGLHAGHLLSKSGVQVKVFESSQRAGGRIFTKKDLFSKNTSIELGGEFIDSNHDDMLSLVKEFGLELLDMEQDVKDNKTVKDAYYFSGRHLSEKDILREFDKYASAIASDAELLENEDGDTLSKFDQINIPDYLSGKGMEGWLFELLVSAYTAEYGIDAAEQSSLNLLYMLDAKSKESFRIFGDSDERYKIKGGNLLLIEKLSQKISDKIHYEHHLSRLAQERGEYHLEFKNGKKIQSRYVILALPFTALRKVKLDIILPESKLNAINQLSYGTNSKLFVAFNGRPWNVAGYAGYLFNDFIQNGWESTQMQDTSQSVYTFFIGGKSGKNLTEATAQPYIEKLVEVFGIPKSDQTGEKAVFNWSNSSLVEGSYSAYKVGQWSSIAGEEAKPVGNLFFAGEHCSENFQGYMNGGAESGRHAAEEVLIRLKAAAGR